MSSGGVRGAAAALPAAFSTYSMSFTSVADHVLVWGGTTQQRVAPAARWEVLDAVQGLGQWVDVHGMESSSGAAGRLAGIWKARRFARANAQGSQGWTHLSGSSDEGIYDASLTPLGSQPGRWHAVAHGGLGNDPSGDATFHVLDLNGDVAASYSDDAYRGYGTAGVYDPLTQKAFVFGIMGGQAKIVTIQDAVEAPYPITSLEGGYADCEPGEDCDRGDAPYDAWDHSTEKMTFPTVILDSVAQDVRYGSTTWSLRSRARLWVDTDFKVGGSVITPREPAVPRGRPYTQLIQAEIPVFKDLLAGGADLVTLRGHVTATIREDAYAQGRDWRAPFPLSLVSVDASGLATFHSPRMLFERENIPLLLDVELGVAPTRLPPGSDDPATLLHAFVERTVESATCGVYTPVELNQPVALPATRWSHPVGPGADPVDVAEVTFVGFSPYQGVQVVPPAGFEVVTPGISTTCDTANIPLIEPHPDGVCVKSPLPDATGDVWPSNRQGGFAVLIHPHLGDRGSHALAVTDPDAPSSDPRAPRAMRAWVDECLPTEAIQRLDDYLSGGGLAADYAFAGNRVGTATFEHEGQEVSRVPAWPQLVFRQNMLAGVGGVTRENGLVDLFFLGQDGKVIPSLAPYYDGPPLADEQELGISAVVTHELTHVFLLPRELPAWVNEGMAAYVEWLRAPEIRESSAFEGHYLRVAAWMGDEERHELHRGLSTSLVGKRLSGDARREAFYLISPYLIMQAHAARVDLWSEWKNQIGDATDVEAWEPADWPARLEEVFGAVYAERMLGEVNGEPLLGLSVVDHAGGSLVVTQQQSNALDFNGTPFGTFTDVPYVLQCSAVDGSTVSGCSGPLVGLTLGARALTSSLDQSYDISCFPSCDLPSLEVRLLSSYQLHSEALGDFAVHDGTTHILGAIDPLPASTLVLCAPGDTIPECGIDVDADGWFVPTDPDDLDPAVFPGAPHPYGEVWTAWDEPGVLATPVPVDVNGDGFPMNWTHISFEE